MESCLRRRPGTGAETARASLWPALSIRLLLIASSGTAGTMAQAAPRSQVGHVASSIESSGGEAPRVQIASDYLRVFGPIPLRLVNPVARERAPRPTYPESEELARDPEAYAASQAARRDGISFPAGREKDDEGTTFSVGGDLLPEVSVSPYSEARIRPEEVIMFFKDERLDGLRGGVAYPAARLRFDPAQPDVRGSSSATYTTQ